MVIMTQPLSENQEKISSNYLGKPEYENISEELKKLPQWVCFSIEPQGDKKPKKIPMNPRTGERAEINDSSTWGTYEEALAACERYGFPCIGFALTAPYCGIDIDNCVKDGKPNQFAQGILDQFSGTYSEYSTSGTGIHLIIKGSKPGTRCRDDKIEIYDNNRFFIFTGDVLNGIPNPILEQQKQLDSRYYSHFPKKEEKPKQSPGQQTLHLDDAEIIEKARSAKNGAKFSALYEGDKSANNNDASVADLALCCILAFYTKDPDQIDRIFRSSGLYRKKWERQDYREETIHKAIANCSGTYNPSEAKRIYNKNKTEKASNEEPWAGVNVPYGYELNHQGVWKLIPSKNKGEGEEQEATAVKISNPVWVAGRSRDYQGSNNGLILGWVDLDKNTREGCFERHQLHTTGNPIAEDLAREGLSIIPGKEKELKSYLAAFETDKTYRAVKSLGWLETPTGDLVYVSKNQTFNQDDLSQQEDFIFQPEAKSDGTPPLGCKGTLAEWQDNVAIPCKGNIVPIFLQCAALAGTIVKHADTGSFGIHLSGFTSRGKTTSAQTAASVIGCAADPSYAPKLSIIKRWNTTANALESLAAQYTDSILVLDEIGQCPKADLDKVIYNLFGGRGKERLSQQAKHKQTREWCTVVISTGEKTLAEMLRETASKTPQGLFVRFIDLHVEHVFTDYHGQSPKDLVDSLKNACGLYYGTPAAEFITRVINDNKTAPALREKISVGCATLSLEIADGASLSQEHSRVLKQFSLIALAGIWASNWGIFPYAKEEILEAARFLFAEWRGSNQKQTEDVRCICTVRDYYVKKRDSAFRPQYLDDNDLKRYGDVYGYTTREGKFFLTEDGLKQALGGLPEKPALKALYNKGYLLREESKDRNFSRKTIDGIGTVRVYVISDEICEFDGESA